MSRLRWTGPLLLFLGCLSCSPNGWAQVKDSGKSSMSRSARISVYLHTNDQNAKLSDILVTLGGEAGNMIDQKPTDRMGKVVFIPPGLGSFTISIHEPGYRDVEENIDLTFTPTASLSIDLQPLPGPTESRSAAPPGPGIAISALDLAIPDGAKKEFDAGQKSLQEEHDPTASIPHFRKALQIDDKFPQAYTMLGLAYLQQQQLKDAQSALEKAVELDSKSGAGYLTLGACLNQEKDFAGAEKALVRGLELDPEAPEGHYELARAFWARGRWQEAEPHASKALSLQPQLAGAHVLMGNILHRKGDDPAAIREFNEYLRLDPNGPMAEPVRAMVARLGKLSAVTK